MEKKTSRVSQFVLVETGKQTMTLQDVLALYSSIQRSCKPLFICNIFILLVNDTHQFGNFYKKLELKVQILAFNLSVILPFSVKICLEILFSFYKFYALWRNNIRKRKKNRNNTFIIKTRINFYCFPAGNVQTLSILWECLGRGRLG